MMGKVMRMEPNKAVNRLELAFAALLSMSICQPRKPLVIVAMNTFLNGRTIVFRYLFRLQPGYSKRLGAI